MDYAQLISLVQIEGIRIVESTSEIKLAADADIAGLVAQLGQFVKLAQPLTDGDLVYRVGFRFGVAPKKVEDPKATPPAELVTVRATFEMKYSLPAGSAPSEDTLDKFGKVNAVFNAWPYWREFLDSALVRMGLPPFVLQVLRMLPRPAASDTMGQAADGAVPATERAPATPAT